MNSLRWYWRLPVKWILFGATVFLVCFPYPSRFVDHVKHWRDPNALIEPDAAVIQPMLEELRPLLADDPLPREALQRVERFVYQKIPYAWDWVTWGTVDYLPTVTEAVEMGREDCDGRAVVAASLLQNLGFEAQIVTDFTHVWVKTDKGEIMGPRKRKVITATKDGLRIQWSAIAELPKGLAYGTAVFPLGREMIIVFVLWLLLIPSNGRFVRSVLGLGALLLGLLALRAGGHDFRNPVVWMQWGGVLLIVGGVVWLILVGRKRTSLEERIAGAPSD